MNDRNKITTTEHLAHQNRTTSNLTTGSQPVFRQVKLEELGRIEIGGTVYGVDSFGDEHILENVGNGQYLDQKYGRNVTINDLIKDYNHEHKADTNRHGLRVAHKRVLEKVKEKATRLDFTSPTGKQTIAIDTENFMLQGRPEQLDKLYSMGFAKFHDKEKMTQIVRGRRTSIPLFKKILRDEKGAFLKNVDGSVKTEYKTAADMYKDAVTKYDQAEHLSPEQLRKNSKYMDRSEINFVKRKIFDQDHTRYASRAKRYLNIKYHIQKSLFSGYVKGEGIALQGNKLRNMRYGQDKASLGGGLFDSQGMHELISDYTSGKEVKSDLIGPKGMEEFKRHTDIDNILKKQGKQLNSESMDKIYKKAVQNYEKNAGIKVLNLRGKRYTFDAGKVVWKNDYKDIASVLKVLQSYELRGNIGSKMESDIIEGMENRLGINQEYFDAVGKVPQTSVQKQLQTYYKYLGEAFPEYKKRRNGLSILDSMVTQTDDVSRILMSSNRKHGTMTPVTPDLMKSGFYDLYGTNKAFAKVSGVQTNEVTQFVDKMYGVVFDKYQGGKTLQNRMRQSDLRFTEPHMANADAAYDAMTQARTKFVLNEIKQLESLPPSEWTAYRKRLLSSEVYNNIASERVFAYHEKELGKTLNERQKYQIQKDMKDLMNKRMGFSAKKEKLILSRFQENANKALKADRRRPRGMVKDMLDRSGTNTVGGMVGGALLVAGIATTMNKALLMMRNHPMKDSEGDIEGLSHNSLQTVLNRLEYTDFGSSYKGPRTSGKTIANIFTDTALDTKFARDSKLLWRNFNTNMKNSFNQNGAISGLFKGLSGSRDQLFKDTGRVVSHVSKGAGKFVAGMNKLPHVHTLLQEGLIKPVKNITSGKIPLSKFIPPILNTSIGKFGLAAGGLLGIGLYALATPGIMKRKSDKDYHGYTEDNKQETIRSTKTATRTQMFSDMLNAKGRGMKYGSLPRELNRQQMTDFRSDRAVGNPTTSLVSASGARPVRTASDVRTADMRVNQMIDRSATDSKSGATEQAANAVGAYISNRNDTEMQFGANVEPIDPVSSYVQYDDSVDNKPHKYDPSHENALMMGRIEKDHGYVKDVSVQRTTKQQYISRDYRNDLRDTPKLQRFGGQTQTGSNTVKDDIPLSDTNIRVNEKRTRAHRPLPEARMGSYAFHRVGNPFQGRREPLEVAHYGSIGNTVAERTYHAPEFDAPVPKVTPEAESTWTRNPQRTLKRPHRFKRTRMGRKATYESINMVSTQHRQPSATFGSFVDHLYRFG